MLKTIVNSISFIETGKVAYRPRVYTAIKPKKNEVGYNDTASPDNQKVNDPSKMIRRPNEKILFFFNPTLWAF